MSTSTGTSNILAIPLRRTHNLQLSSAIRTYISSKYDQHPDTFARDLEVIDALRKDAVNALEPHVSGVRKLQAYAAQLVWMGGKFPVDIGADFTWYPSLGYRTSHATTDNNVRFELANVLFNLAAMYSQLALSSNRATSDGLKTAASNFCWAAGVISHLKSNVVPEMRVAGPPEDMDSMTLESLELLMLAQAQECFWQKAVKDGLKDSSIAKLAAKVCDLYSEAGDWALKSDSISSEWIHHTSAKHHHFAGAAQYRAACACLENRKYGEEVARLRDSLACVNEALKEARYVNKAVLADMNGLKNRVSDDLKRSEKDNDTIYLQPVPAKSELNTLDRASMVAARVPKEVAQSQELLGDKGELGRPLFAKLVPYSVHVAASIYADRRDRLVNNTIIAELETLTQRMHETLSSLNLPGSLQALEKPLGLPPSLASHAEEIRQANGVHRLHATISDTEKLKASNRNLYQEGVDLLRTEATEDENARRRYGTDRWNRIPGQQAVPKLYAQINDVDNYLKQSDNSDQLVQNKLRENESLIRLLGGTNRDLEDYVPSSRRATMTAKVEREANGLRATLNEVSRLETRRRRKVEALRTKAREDDVNPDLLKEATRLEREMPMQPVSASQFESLFDRRLRKYEPDEAEVKKEGDDQDALLDRMRAANASFQQAKKGDSSSKEREQALQDLENGYNTYKQILRDLEAGRKFYNDLSALTTRFRDECRNYVYARRAEAQGLESDLITAMQSLSVQQSTQRSLRSEKQAQAQKQQAPPVARMVSSGSGAQGGDALPAPTPQRPQQQPPPVTTVKTPAAQQAMHNLPMPTTWQEGMPIKFSGGGS
ncbi:BRO1-domain-containing protein [Polychaeton citri CBS 116435]|uniref:BRO1-domain-containing protein n=1 Tax=Polychaeton citri CBS 116435 TaxID=1314669 RepID=A0A9P4UPH2_9PEZI|nr:BRO1-domain-containing protein [Polychaeton citri CBS 116435]